MITIRKTTTRTHGQEFCIVQVEYRMIDSSDVTGEVVEDKQLFLLSYSDAPHVVSVYDSQMINVERFISLGMEISSLISRNEDVVFHVQDIDNGVLTRDEYIDIGYPKDFLQHVTVDT